MKPLTREEIERLEAEMYAADLHCFGALPLTPFDERALDRIRRRVLAEAAQLERDGKLWRRVWRYLWWGQS